MSLKVVCDNFISFCDEGLTSSFLHHSRSSALLSFCYFKTYVLWSTLIAMVWMFVFPANSDIGTPMPNRRVLGSEIFGWWVGREDGALMNGLNALIRNPAELPSAFHHRRIQWEVSCLHVEEDPHYKSCWHPGLGLLAFRTVGDKFLPFIILSFSDVLWNSPNGLRHQSSVYSSMAHYIWEHHCHHHSEEDIEHVKLLSFPGLYAHPRVNCSSDIFHFTLIFPVLKLHVNEILQYLLFCFQLLFIHHDIFWDSSMCFGCYRDLFFNCCVIFYLWISHNFLIGSHFGLFTVWAIISKAMNILLHVFLWA